MHTPIFISYSVIKPLISYFTVFCALRVFCALLRHNSNMYCDSRLMLHCDLVSQQAGWNSMRICCPRSTSVDVARSNGQLMTMRVMCPKYMTLYMQSTYIHYDYTKRVELVKEIHRRSYFYIENRKTLMHSKIITSIPKMIYHRNKHVQHSVLSFRKSYPPPGEVHIKKVQLCLPFLTHKKATTPRAVFSNIKLHVSPDMFPPTKKKTRMQPRPRYGAVKLPKLFDKCKYR